MFRAAFPPIISSSLLYISIAIFYTVLMTVCYQEQDGTAVLNVFLTSSQILTPLTLNLLTTTIFAPPSNASKWQMAFNSAFKGLKHIQVSCPYPCTTNTFSINTDKCTRILSNHDFINTKHNTNTFQPLKGHLQGVKFIFRQRGSIK
jgi:hypothetical protein